MEGTAVTREEVREASARLPERQREALELRDRDGRSYEEIAARLEIGPGAVAQLIAHARINLYDELRGTALASVAPSPECERALPLIAMREDGQLEAPSDDADWLDAHLAGCERCTLAVEQMGEADAAYRAQESERPGGDADRTDGPAARIRRPDTRPPEPAGIPVATPARRSRRTLLVATLAGLLLLGGGVAVLAATDRSTAPVESVVKPAAEQSAGGGELTTRPTGKSENGPRGDHEKQVARRSGAGGEGAADSAAGAAESPAALPVVAPAEGGSDGAAPGNSDSGKNRSSGKAAVDRTRQTSSSKPSAKPKSPPASTSAPPSTATAPPSESPPPAEEEVDEPGHRGEPPGKAVGRPPH